MLDTAVCVKLQSWCFWKR